MSTTVDPTWAVPVVCLVIAAIAVTWAKLFARAEERRYRVGSNTPATPQAEPSQHR